MTLLVRDEEDILEAHLRYHFAAGVDFVIATDNRSEDGTKEILRAHEREGRLLLFEEDGDNYDQGRWVTRMARLAATEHGADWVINSDADEFWWPDEGDLKAVFEAVPPTHLAVKARIRNFVPRPPSTEPFFRSMTARVREPTTKGATTEPRREPAAKVCHRALRDIELGRGNHAAFRRRLFWRRRLPAPRAPLTVLHFPVRSYAQFANKIEKTGAAMARNGKLPAASKAWPARVLYEAFLRGELKAHYERLVCDDDAIRAGIADGTLVLDQRLRDRLDVLGLGESGQPS